MPEPYSLPTEPEAVAASLLERFSSGKVSMMMALYEPEAVLIGVTSTRGSASLRRFRKSAGRCCSGRLS